MGKANYTKITSGLVLSGSFPPVRNAEAFSPKCQVGRVGAALGSGEKTKKEESQNLQKTTANALLTC